MERLLGATGLSQGGTYEEKSAVVGKITVPRGPTFEDISFGANARVSSASLKEQITSQNTHPLLVSCA